MAMVGHERADAVVAGLPQTAPDDEHNRALVGNVRPLDWVNPEPAARYDMVVLGGGTAGLVTAAGSAGVGAKVALVERALLGGDCLNVGCVPSKAVIRSARAAAEARRAARLGVRIGGDIEVDFPAVMERMRRLRARISPHDSAARFRELGIDVFFGSARFGGRDTVVVDGATLSFKRACIATGGRPRVPEVEGLAEAGFLTNETVFSLTELPSRLAVIGAGPIGCELAQTFARCGSRVTLVQREPQILVREDRDAAAIVERALAADGVEIAFDSSLDKVESRPEGKLVTLTTSAGTRELVVDEILLGAGRVPNVEGLGLEAAGVGATPRGVEVDDRLRTANRRIYAAGDVCLPYQFTHTADAAARMVIRNALFFGRQRVSDLVVPWCTYTDPEIAHVGLYARQAEERGLAVETVRIELSAVDRAILEGEDEGFLKVYVEKGKGRILGATLVSSHAGETIAEIGVAMKAGLGLGALSDVIHSYPTQAEAVRKAGDLYNRGRLTPRAKRVLGWILRLQR